MTNKIKYTDLKGSYGFIICWLVLTLFSASIIWFDWKTAVLGIILSISLGFLGFDILNDFINKCKISKRKDDK